jgi:hypothetical protein
MRSMQDRSGVTKGGSQGAARQLVVGADPYVSLHFLGAERYAK